MKKNLLTTLFIILFVVAQAQSKGGAIAGRVVDNATGEPVIGAAVVLSGTHRGVSTNLDGHFEISPVAAGSYTLEVNILSYKPFHSSAVVVEPGKVTTLDISLVEQSSTLENVVVVARRSVNTDAGLLGQMRDLRGVVSGVSAQQISRTQDKDASEVVRRIPGVSIIDDKFVIVRGLAQRYNNTWVNNSAVPSAEADSRAFSFDIIPSSQIDNILIVKAPAPEYPADFSGGFVVIKTKSIPDSNSFSVGYGTGLNTATSSNRFLRSANSPTDLLGFDNGTRSMGSSIPAVSDNQPSQDAINKMTRSGFNNDWRIRSTTATPDQKFNMAINRTVATQGGDRLGLNASLNYSYSNKSILDMVNNQYYPSSERTLRHEYSDDQYTTDVKLGAMLNLMWQPKSSDVLTSRYEFRNMVNQLGKSRLTLRQGESYYANREQFQTESLYQSRTAYSGQLSGYHTLHNSRATTLDWTGSYSYSNRNQPDRRIERRERRPDLGIQEYIISQNSVSRYFNTLNENVASLGANFTTKLNPSAQKPIELRAGIYGEGKWRNYATRTFNYYWQGSLSAELLSKPIDQILSNENLGYPNNIYLVDGTAMTDDYSANATTLAAYAALNIPLGRWNIYGGVRMESYRANVVEYRNNIGSSSRNHKYAYNNPLPSLNISYDINKSSLLRLACGMTVNRPEFRELSRSSYFDFDIFSFVQGDPNLKQATIKSVDFRYELYPSADEMISVALFYKGFKNPIEWSYVETGAAYEFRFVNAQRATNYGIEVDVRKNLNFIGLPRFTLVANAAWIRSSVNFKDEYTSYSRPMQGQSPYLVNTGIFYANSKKSLSLGLLYNRIGRRIIGIGRVISSSSETISNSVPDMYELPRDVLDLTASIRLYRTLELKIAAKDMLSSDVVYAQFPRNAKRGLSSERQQTTRRYDSGRNFSIALSATF